MNSNEGLNIKELVWLKNILINDCGVPDDRAEPIAEILLTLGYRRATPSNEPSGATTADVISVHEGTKWYRGECCSGYPNCIHRPPNRGFIAPTKTNEPSGEGETANDIAWQAGYKAGKESVKPPTKTMGGDDGTILKNILKEWGVFEITPPGVNLMRVDLSQAILQSGFHRDVPSLMALDKIELVRISEEYKNKISPITAKNMQVFDDFTDEVYAKFSKPAVPDVGGLSPSEALYGFCGWITTRKEKVCAGSTEDCAIWAELVKEFCETNNLESPRENWTQYLTSFRTAQKGTNEKAE